MRPNEAVPIDQLKFATAPAGKTDHVLTLLNEVGRLSNPVKPSTYASWIKKLHKGAGSPRLELAVAEVLLGWEEPQQALERLERIQRRTKPTDPVYGLAKYDATIAKYYRGKYAQAADEFEGLLKTSLKGFNRKDAAIWARHARACQGYHEGHALLGITQPPHLDPLCGATSLAACLRAIGMPYAKSQVIPVTHSTGMGSTMLDLKNACDALGVAGQVVQLDQKALIDLPKPMVAHVEHDHFVAVTRADKSGVTYLCSDCGPWPGGDRKVTWAQWKAMDADVYLSVSKKGSVADQALSLLRAKQTPDPIPLSYRGMMPLFLMARAPQSVTTLVGLLQAHAVAYIATPINQYWCGSKPDAQHCDPCNTPCPNDTPGSAPGAVAMATPTGASAGDPVNLATGEEEYRTGLDLHVYNPIGPSVGLQRLYNSLRNCWTGFGLSWSHNYYVGVIDESVTENTGAPTQGDTGTAGVDDGQTGGTTGGGIVNPPATIANHYILLDNGARVPFTPASSTAPTAVSPQVLCTTQTGYPYKVTWDYNATTGGTFYTVVFKDRSKWITADRNATHFVPIKKLVDSYGNWIGFTWLEYTEAFSGYPTYPFKRLTQISDSTGTALVTFALDANKNYVSASDRYGRSVYYHSGSYATSNVPYPYPQSQYELDSVSQIVTTGTSTPPARYTYGYALSQFGHPGGELSPFLHTITVPSPTGTGTATATINYDNRGVVSSLVDANGNTRSYLDTTTNETKVTVKNSSGTTELQYSLAFDGSMRLTAEKDANGNTTRTYAYTDAQNPLGASTSTDYASHTRTQTFDAYGNMTSAISARGATTTFTYSYANFAMGELTGITRSSLPVIQYTYNQPSGKLATMQMQKPGDVGTGNMVNYAFTYDALGNQTQVTRPGNEAYASLTTTNSFTTDGTYTQTAARGQVVASTNSRGKVTHYRYDTRGNKISEKDANGNTRTFTYNIADQILTITESAVVTGAGNVVTTLTYLYPGGPLTSSTERDEAGAIARQTVFTYDQEGHRLSGTGDIEPGTVTYNSYYQVKSIVDGAGNGLSFLYDTRGNRTRSTNQDGTYKTYAYNTLGYMSSLTDERGVVRNYAYSDPENKLTDVTYPSQTSQNVHITYDSLGRLATWSDGAGSYTASFDDFGLPIQYTQTYTGVPAVTLGKTYNPDGSVKTLTLGGGQQFHYAYDQNANEVGLTNADGLNWTWTYSDNDWLTNETQVETGLQANYSYNGRGFVVGMYRPGTGAANQAAQFSSIQHDTAGQLTSMTTTCPAWTASSGTFTATYDSRNQLLSEAMTGGLAYSNSYAYNSGSNPTTFRGVSTSFNNLNQPTAAGDVYDASGNPTTYGGSSIAYDVESRPTAFGGTTLTAGYRADGLRAYKETSAGRRYFYYFGDKLVLEKDGSGTTLAKITVGDHGTLARNDAVGNRVYAFDPLGSCVAQVDASSGTVLASYAYDAFGRRSSNSTNPGLLNDPNAGFHSKNGYYYDSETGLYLLQHRYYDPARGRFVTRDPIGHLGGLNLYAYCVNNPVNGIDPTGYIPCQNVVQVLAACGLGMIGAIGALINDLLTGNANGLGALCEAGAGCLGAVATCLAYYYDPVGCIAGAIGGAVTALGNSFCNWLLQPCHPFNLLCTLADAAVSAGLGCLSGGMGGSEGGSAVGATIFGILMNFFGEGALNGCKSVLGQGCTKGDATVKAPA